MEKNKLFLQTKPGFITNCFIANMMWVQSKLYLYFESIRFSTRNSAGHFSNDNQQNGFFTNFYWNRKNSAVIILTVHPI